MPLSYALAGPVAALARARATTLIGAGVLGSVITLAFLFLPGMRALASCRRSIAPAAGAHEPAA